MRSGKNRAFDEKNFLPQGVDHGNAKNIRFFEKNFFSQVVEHEIAVFMNDFENFSPSVRHREGPKLNQFKKTIYLSTW